MEFKKGLKRAGAVGLIGLASLLSNGKNADAAAIRVRSDSPITQNGNYTVYVEAENTGLLGQTTDGLDWRLNAPAYLGDWTVSKPLAADDFFEGKPMDPSDVFAKPNGLSGRLVADYGNGEVDKTWSQLAVYNFTVNYSGSLPANGSLTLSDVAFWDLNGGSQGPITVNDYSFTITPEPTTVVSALVGGAALLAANRRKRSKLEEKI